MNTANAALLLDAHNVTHDRIYQDTIPNGGSDTYLIASGRQRPLKATLVWTDPEGPAAPLTALDPTTLRLVNDLDMSATFSGGGGTIFPWVLDPANSPPPPPPATTTATTSSRF